MLLFCLFYPTAKGIPTAIPLYSLDVDQRGRLMKLDKEILKVAKKEAVERVAAI